VFGLPFNLYAFDGTAKMSGSIVFYRFKAQKEASTVQFEGTGISVWDLKKEILAENKLGKGADFDFAIYNADTNEGEFDRVAALDGCETNL
jgi:hypothetical protein